MSGDYWLVYYADRSAMWVFDGDDELSALRKAVEAHAEIRAMTWGEEI